MDSALAVLSDLPPQREGWLTIAIHGRSFVDHIQPRGLPATTSQPHTDQIDALNLKGLISDAGVRLDNYKGIIFVSCFGGSCSPVGSSQASKVADAFGLDVIAADGLIRIGNPSPDLRMWVTHPQNSGDPSQAPTNPWYQVKTNKPRRTSPRAEPSETQKILDDLNGLHRLSRPIQW